MSDPEFQYAPAPAPDGDTSPENAASPQNGCAAPGAVPPGEPIVYAPAPYPYGTPIPPRPFVSDRRDTGLLLIAAVVGVLIREWLFAPAQPGFSVLALTAVVYGGIFWYGSGCPSFSIRAGAPLFVPIGITLLCFALFSNPLLGFFDVILLYGLIAVQLGRMFGRKQRFVLPEIFHSALAAPFINASAFFKTARQTRTDGRGKNAWRVAVGLLISIPVAAIVLVLLASADGAFESALNTLQAHIGQTVGRVLLDIILGLALAIFLFSLAYTLRYAPNTEKARMPGKPGRLDSVIIATVLFVCAAIYVCFFVVQFRYLFSAVWGTLPSDYIYSEYARRGFFELLAVAFINLGLTLLARFSAHGDRPVMKFAEVLLAVQTLVLIGSALSKMVMYVQVYGMTPLRIYTSWFMVLLCFVFLVLIIGRFVQFRVWNVLTAGFVALFLLLNLMQPNRMIAEWNTNRYLDGTLNSVDTELLKSLGAEAVSPLLRLTHDTNPVVRENAGRALEDIQIQLEEQSDWCSMSAASLIARAKLDGTAS